MSGHVLIVQIEHEVQVHDAFIEFVYTIDNVLAANVKAKDVAALSSSVHSRCSLKN